MEIGNKTFKISKIRRYCYKGPIPKSGTIFEKSGPSKTPKWKVTANLIGNSDRDLQIIENLEIPLYEGFNKTWTRIEYSLLEVKLQTENPMCQITEDLVGSSDRNIQNTENVEVTLYGGYSKEQEVDLH